MASLLVQPPLGGIQRQTGYQNRPPYSAYSLRNLWPIDPISGRAIIATRPPFTELATPADICTLLRNVSAVSVANPTLSFLGAFGGSLYWWNGTGFTAATGGITVPTTTAVYCGTLFHEVYIPRSGANKIAVFNYETGNTAAIVETVGTAPDDVFFITDWLGAIVAVTNDEPEILQISRIGNGKDWDFSAPIEDEFGAYSSTVTSPGGIGAPITGFASRSDDTALISTLAGSFLLRGHPRRGGVFDKVLDTYMLGQGAWARGQDDTIYFLTPEGMFTIPPGSGSMPAPLSKGKIPEELIGLDYEFGDPMVSMAYDSRWNGVIIAVRGAQQQAWRYDINTGGFFLEEYSGYPFVLMEHKPFLTDQSSGVLWGGVKTNFHDKFGIETFSADAVIGPVKIADSSVRKKKIIRAKVIFGGDTPTDTGFFTVATGTDGQDAITRVLTGSGQYTVPIEELKNSDGVCFPATSGSAAVFQVSSDQGRLSIEGIDVDMVDAGVNRVPRVTQLSQEGESIDFTAPNDDFDDENWVGYTENTPAVPLCSLPDHTLFVDLSRLPIGWWDQVTTSGSDIRVTDNNNNEKAYDLIHFDKVLKTGFLTLKITQQNPPTPVRIWSGNPFVSSYAPTAPFGQYNAYDTNWIAFYPDGGADQFDRTVNQNHLTLVGLPSPSSGALEAGLIGVLSTDYRTVDATNNYGVATAVIPASYPVTLVAVVQQTVAQTIDCLGLYTTAGGDQLRLQAQRTGGLILQSSIEYTGSANEVAGSTTIPADNNFHHYVGVAVSNISRDALLDGANKGSDIDPSTIAGLNEIVIGKGSRSPLSSSSLNGNICLAQVHNTNRSDCWVDYQARMLDQDLFWGDWDDYLIVNDPGDIVPVDPPPTDTTTCPLGFITPVEVGTWSGYAEATPDAPSVNQPNWVHWIDLSDMPAAWWAAVKADGSDIRATNSSNKFIPLDLIEFNSATNTGFACVRLDQFAAGAAPIRLWVGNATSITLTACATYGRYRVYDEFWVGFWPDGGGEDRTGYRNDMQVVPTAIPSIVVGGVNGPIGNKATNYNDVGSGPQFSRVVIDTPSDTKNYPIMVAAVARTPAYEEVVTVATFAHRNFPATHHFAVVHCFYEPCSAIRVPGLLQIKSLTVETINNWHHKFGAWLNSVTRHISVNGGTLASAPKLAQPQWLVPGQFSIGAGGTSGQLINPFNGDICLVSLHNAARVEDNSWAAYQYAMLDQNAFYNLGGGTWTWTAESNDLDQ